MEKKLSVFVVDDDVFYLKSIILTLNKDFGSKVMFKFFFSSDSLLTKLKADDEPVDLILLDYNLEVDDQLQGVDLVNEIKKIQPKVEVVLVSAQKNNQVIMSMLKSGASSYVQKNYETFKVVRDLIDSLLKKKFMRSKIFRPLYFFTFIFSMTLLLLLVFSLL
ncbi:MAG: response regulator [Flavobacteriales bacterium]